MISIRKATENDAQAAWDLRIAAICSQCTGHYPQNLLDIWTDGRITDRYRRVVAEHFHVAVHGRRVVGTGMIDLARGWIDAIFVCPDNMRQGTGRMMMSYLEQLAVDSGLTQLQLESTLNAASFYRTCGFTGDMVSTYQSPRGISLDCIPMTKTLPEI